MFFALSDSASSTAAAAAAAAATLTSLNSAKASKQGKNVQALIDTAVALWIGKEQQEAGTNGWMLYAVGQTAAMNFGHDGEAATNSQLMIQFNKMQRVAGQCTEDPDVHLDLRLQVSETIRLLSIPLLQQLLFHIAINDRWHVELYAISVVSQLVACHPQAYMELSDILFSGFTPEKVGEDVVDHLVTFMECTRISCEDITTGTAAPTDLQDFVAQICQRLNQRGNIVSIRGYVSSTDIREQSRIDLDILQIDIFMRMEAREAALDYYMNGHNSLTSSSSTGGSANITLSLHSLATSVERTRSLNFELFSDSHGTDAYADDLIQKCFAKEYPLNGTSPLQLAALVTTSLQAMVSYRIILAKLQVSVEKCNQLDGEGAQVEWDGAVATFVGCIDMAYPNRNPHASGKLMYSLGLEQCQYFSTCQETGEAFSNVALLKHFANGKGLVVDGDCSLAESIIASNIAPLMQTLIVQGALHYSIENENLTAGSKESLAIGFVLAKAIQPLVNHTNVTSARTLATSFEFPLSNVSTQEGAENVFGAFRYVLRNMSIDCDDIGQPLDRPDLKVCFGDSQHDDHSTLGIELYVPTSLTMQQTNIAMDVAEMAKALSAGMPSVAKMIYSTGKNSKFFDDSGQFMKMRTLRGLSVNSTLEMFNDPLFNIFMFALQKEGGSNGVEQVNGRRLLVETREYADGVVQDALDSLEPSNSTLASEASVALNVWMYTAHLLYDAVRKCRKEEIADGKGERAIDEAAAFWIGDGQGFQEVDGHLLYGLAEAMGRVFDTVEQGQSRTNRNILNLLKDANGQITSCSSDPASITQLHVTINKIISMMMVPLVQGLIHNLNVNDRDRVKVFAYAFVPMTAGCSSDAFTFLRNKLIHLTYDPVETSEIVDRVYQSLPCLNLRCEDVGIHYSDSLGNPGNDTQGNHTWSAWSTSTCLGAPSLVPMAGYHPASNVVAYAMLDLDLREMDILMQMNAFEAAGDIYLHGKHSTMVGTNGSFLSLAQVAKVSERTSIPIFSSFSKYYESDSFADKLIQGAITRSDEIFSESDRRAIVLRASQVMVAYFGAVSAMYDASTECKANIGSSQAWDTASALMIGSLEGRADGGSLKEGYFLFDLAQEQCREFGRCAQNQTAISNENLVTFLYAGRGGAKSKSCEVLENMRTQVSSALLVPMIQATLSASLRLSKKNHERDDAVEGFVFSRALLPIVAAVDRSAADAIQEAFDLNQEERLPIDKTIIFAAFSRVYEELGINCRHIGKAEGVDACDKFDFDALRKKKKKKKRAILEGDVSQSALGGITVALVILVAAVFIIRLEIKKNGGFRLANKRKLLGFFRRFNIGSKSSKCNKEKSSLDRTYLSRGHFRASSTSLSSEAMRLTSSVRFCEHRQGGDEDDSETTWVISNTDGREPADIACC